MRKKMITKINNVIKEVATRKANANCLGLMYEPKKPECLKKSKEETSYEKV